jgi:hypothetical protein
MPKIIGRGGIQDMNEDARWRQRWWRRVWAGIKALIGKKGA